jgi:hypothetical protein
VALFLALLVVCALAAWNLWPFPAWELFSRLRTDRQNSWLATSVDRTGRERAYPFGSRPHGYRGFRFIVAGFAGRSTADRDAICAAWLGGAKRRSGPSIRRVRIYRLDWRLSNRRDSRAAPPHRTLAWTCTRSGARRASPAPR